MIQTKEKVLAISVACPSTVEIGDPVLLSGDLTCKAIDALASTYLLGVVVEHEDDAETCVVATRFRERRDDRVSYGGPSVGPFVLNAAGKAINYVLGTYASHLGLQDETYNITAIASVTSGNAETYDVMAYATKTSSNAETYAIVGSTSDAVKISVGGGEDQDFTLTAGGTQSAANVVSDFAAAVDFTVEAVEGSVVFTCDNPGDTLQFKAVDNDAYTVLGLSEETITPNGQLKVSIEGGSSQTFTIVAANDAAATADEIATQINLTAVDFTADGSSGSVVLTCDNPGDTLEIEAVAADCYTVLDLTAEKTECNNVLSVTIEGGDEQEFLICEEDDAALTAAEVIAAINATAVDFHAVPSGGAVNLVCLDIDKDLVVNATDSDCYTALGFTADTYTSDAPTYGPESILGLIINKPAAATVTGSEGGTFAITTGSNDKFKLNGTTVTLTQGAARTATQVAAEISGAVSGVTASVVYGQKIKLTADAPYVDLVIATVANDAYDTLGFSTGTTVASLVVETLEY